MEDNRHIESVCKHKKGLIHRPSSLLDWIVFIEELEHPLIVVDAVVFVVNTMSLVFILYPDIVFIQVIQRIFDYHLGKDPRLFIIGEDVGKLGGVNLEFDGLLEKHGEHRITDTGIREATILGQGIGAAVRGLRSLATGKHHRRFIFGQFIP